MAVRIVGVDLPQNKRGEIALTYIFGIGRSAAKSILDKAGVDRDIKVKDWTDEQSAKVREVISAEHKVEDKLLIADEPTTALDVTIQAQVLELMKDLINNRDMSMLMITHSLGIVAEICDDMAVMYAGRIVEKGTVDDVFNSMRHPYTEGLFNSLPNLKEQGDQ